MQHPTGCWGISSSLQQHKQPGQALNVAWPHTYMLHTHHSICLKGCSSTMYQHTLASYATSQQACEAAICLLTTTIPSSCYPNPPCPPQFPQLLPPTPPPFFAGSTSPKPTSQRWTSPAEPSSMAQAPRCQTAHPRSSPLPAATASRWRRHQPSPSAFPPRP